ERGPTAGVSGNGQHMSDYLAHLVARTLERTPVIQPRLPSVFEPLPAAGQRIREQSTGSEVRRPPGIGFEAELGTLPSAEPDTKVMNHGTSQTDLRIPQPTIGCRELVEVVKGNQSYEPSTKLPSVGGELASPTSPSVPQRGRRPEDGAITKQTS